MISRASRDNTLRVGDLDHFLGGGDERRLGPGAPLTGQGPSGNTATYRYLPEGHGARPIGIGTP
jgi:hypothetical protein